MFFFVFISYVFERLKQAEADRCHKALAYFRIIFVSNAAQQVFNYFCFVKAEMVAALPDWKGHPLGPPIVVHCSAGIVDPQFVC